MIKKKLITIRILFSVVTEMIGCFLISSAPSSPTNGASQFAIRALVPAGTGTVSGRSNWQLAIRTVHSRAAELFAAAGGVFENLLTPQVGVN
jgi:hypothetical protein